MAHGYTRLFLLSLVMFASFWFVGQEMSVAADLELLFLVVAVLLFLAGVLLTTVSRRAGYLLFAVVFALGAANGLAILWWGKQSLLLLFAALIASVLGFVGAVQEASKPSLKKEQSTNSPSESVEVYDVNSTHTASNEPVVPEIQIEDEPLTRRGRKGKRGRRKAKRLM